MAASLGFEPKFLVPEANVLPARRRGTKKTPPYGAMNRFFE